ncbi:hypothetical protein MSM1_05650 [Mycobacterium sp. SM1]|nr:hypothetical protein [Mycobacterium sp. SM1]MBS4727851.1 hypothetical protein [Mycobacterium sp. SM1]
MTAADPGGSGAGADPTGPEVTAADPGGSGAGADLTGPEVTAEVLTGGGEDASSERALAVERGASRLGGGWLLCIAAALVLLAGGVSAGGYFALRAHREDQRIARADRTAVAAAKDCVAATQAPDTAAMAAAAQKIIECSTGAFGTQAVLYSGLLVEAYQAANVHVQVSDMRAAVERNNADGSIDVLVALRVKVSNAQAKNQENGYRLRVTMAPDEGKYKISKLEQVTK